MCATAQIERRGIPVDTAIYRPLKQNWDAIIHQLIKDADVYGVYDENDEFKEQRFSDLVSEWGIPWPRLETGRVELKKTTFSDIAKLDSRIQAIHEVRKTRAMLRATNLQVGADGRARTLLWAFGAKTGRTQPRASEYIFSPAKWMRFLAKPARGMALAYLDYRAQEFGIAAWYSRDENMLAAYPMAIRIQRWRRKPGPSMTPRRKSIGRKFAGTIRLSTLGSCMGWGCNR